MNRFIKILFVIGLLLGVSKVEAQRIIDAFEAGNTNVTGAFVWIPPGQTEGQTVIKVTDIALEQNISGAYVQIFAPKSYVYTTHALAASGTNIMVTAGSATNGWAANDYLIVENGTTFQLTQLDLNGASTTNFYTTTALTAAQPAGSKVYYVGSLKERWGAYAMATVTGATTNNVYMGNKVSELYFKGGMPVGLKATNSAAAARTEFYVNGVYQAN